MCHFSIFIFFHDEQMVRVSKLSKQVGYSYLMSQIVMVIFMIIFMIIFKSTPN